MTVHTHPQQVSSWLARYQAIRQQSLNLCAPLQTEDYVAQPVPFVSPPKWHLGHTTWFFENFILAAHYQGYQCFNEALNYCFNSYYQSQGPRILRDKRGNLTRPPLSEIQRYRSYVDQHMLDFLSTFGSGSLPGQLALLLEVGLQHEQQHQELLVTDIKYILGHNPMHQPYTQPGARAGKVDATAPMSFATVPEGVYEIGHKGEGFCWDNELGRHKAYLQEFQIANRPVTNEEYMAFMADGGYEHFAYWLDDGWAWAQQQEVKAPLYWYQQDGQWWQYTLNGLQPVAPSEPVTHINYYEADAFANWKGMRLPTEQEWEAACMLHSPEPTAQSNFVESERWQPVAASSEDGFQMLGNTWEWTASAYLPYPGYPRFKGALGEYNGKFMVNQMVLRGGSCATPRSHIRPTYRNFFYPQERWQFTGLRLAQ
ncbi:ergothioneine biosynthesis protein EgtB [Phaeodactylibacter luteus]|uniref:Ergothioneine biosynthesis protein EgtB n=1 Tax=Phaeodactylibacter luteus TaxID=1564516 RepID=A0A5C6RL72_9BACT|nr:ergothioneine biosynthesis protein EgtB [Phaeodactylibacter luteus]TXB63128.1 ergothioneine biosynthesis protein EgtB [Phaeodactylibacter luteus]